MTLSLMRNQMDIYGWTIAYDPVTTALIMARMTSGSPERCGCMDCQNWIASRESAFPPEIKLLFQRLSIRADRESEMGTALDLGNNRCLYNGWFHFVGQIVHGPSIYTSIATVEPHGKHESGKVFQLTLHHVSDTFSIGFSDKKHLLPAEFEGLPTVQLEFITDIQLRK